MGKKITITIEGYGKIKVKKPKEFNEETFADGVAEAVAKTMQLISPRTQVERFHPVLGKGGYVT